jgi:hypothetical protein
MRALALIAAGLLAAEAVHCFVAAWRAGWRARP